MKSVTIVVVLFLLPFSALAGTFLETFDHKGLADWQELVQGNKDPGVWDVVGDELHAVSHETFLRLLTTGDDTWEDYTIEFDVKPLKKHGRSAIAIAARVKGSVLFYCSFADPVVLVNDDPLLGSWVDCSDRRFARCKVFTPLRWAPSAFKIEQVVASKVKR